jgi:hypothetical protein
MLLTVQRFCKRTNVDVPSTVLGTSDPQVKQILALLEEEGNDLASRGDWQELTNEATHTTVATESQGAISTIASNGFKYIKNGTIWDQDLSLPVYVVDGGDWQQIKAINVTGPRYQARLRGGLLISNPVPTAGHTWVFEYMTKNWTTDSAGANPDQYFNADTDLMLLPEELLLLGLRWRWLKEKGLEYAEQFRTYEIQVKDALSRNGMRTKLSMSNRPYSPKPQVYVPTGDWAL